MTKGKTNNPHGRPKGVGNKVTTDLRQSVTAFLDANWPKVQKEFDSLEAKDKLQFIDKMLAYSLPKLQATTLTTDFESLSDTQLDYILNGLTTKFK